MISEKFVGFADFLKNFYCTSLQAMIINKENLVLLKKKDFIWDYSHVNKV